MSESLASHYLNDALESFRAYKKLAEKALSQLNDDEFFLTLDEEANSVAVIMKHIAGNMLSRWTDFLSTDGEKPDRQRDREFVIEPGTTKEDVIAFWEKGWQCLFTALEPLQPADFERTVLIRGEAHTIVQAINRQLTHYACHIGQIVYLAKHYRSTDWKSLSIPKNRSAEFNRQSAIGNRPSAMSLTITELHHVNVTVPRSIGDAAKHFYGSVLGLREVPKPAESRGHGGAWYQLGNVQLHLSLEDPTDSHASRRHVCLIVADLEGARRHLEGRDVEVFPDDSPTPGGPRFYVRDPGGNRIEIAQPV